ncbi:MAG: hypothetical protein IT380_00965 [Myxococcales bacterium]|nr:hypothetical protein [Myxococcales bacterium]
MSDWNDDYVDLCALLLAEGAEFVVVGAYALAAHGVPRATGDIDFFVRPTRENAGRVFRALQKFGAPLSAMGLTEADLERAGTVYQIGIAPRRIDVLTALSGVTFDEAWTSRITRDVRGHAVPFLGRAQLEANKSAAGRPKDLLDLELLAATRR